MKNPLYHKHINLHNNKYFFDFIQLYFPIPQDDLKERNIYDIPQINNWLNMTYKDLEQSLRHIPNYNEGIQFYSDIKFKGIKIYFSGKFFIHQNYKDDLTRFKKFADIFYRIILNNTYKVHEWKPIEFPEFYISQVHLAENLYFKNYPDKLENNNYDIYGHGHLVNNKNCEDKIWRDMSSHTQTGHACGVKDFVYLTVYDKRYKEPEHSLERFKTFQFYRREWKIQKKKLKSLHLNHYEDFLLLKNNVQLFKHFVSSIRKTLDLVLKNDSTEYCIFHFQDIDLNTYKSISDECVNFGKKAILKLSSRASKYVPISHRNTMYWDGVDNIVGIIRGYKNRWTTEKWLKVVNELCQEPDRLPAIKKNDGIDYTKVQGFLDYINGK